MFWICILLLASNLQNSPQSTKMQAYMVEKSIEEAGCQELGNFEQFGALFDDILAQKEQHRFAYFPYPTQNGILQIPVQVEAPNLLYCGLQWRGYICLESTSEKKQFGQRKIELQEAFSKQIETDLGYFPGLMIPIGREILIADFSENIANPAIEAYGRLWEAMAQRTYQKSLDQLSYREADELVKKARFNLTVKSSELSLPTD